MITEINRLDIGFESLIEKSFIEQQLRTGDTIHNGHERYISFNIIILINLGQKPISHIPVTGLCLPGQYPPQARTHWRSSASVMKRFPSSLMIRQSGVFLPDNHFQPLLLNVRKDRSLSTGRIAVICSTLIVSGLTCKKQPTRAYPWGRTAVICSTLIVSGLTYKKTAYKGLSEPT
jgi:hypothetical protein